MHMGLKKKGGEWYNQKEIVTRRKSGKVGKRRRKKKMTNKKKMMIMGIAGGTILVIALAYMGAAIFFTRHFLMNTEINGVDFSGKSLAEAEEYFKGQVGEYTLTISIRKIEKDTIPYSSPAIKPDFIINIFPYSFCFSFRFFSKEIFISPINLHP